MRTAIVAAFVVVPGTAWAQFEIGASGGIFHYDLNGASGGSPYAPTFTDIPSFSFTGAVHYRERSGGAANFFADLSLVRRSFSTHITSGGLGGGTHQYLDVRLDHVYLTFGPEFGSDQFSLRFGLQFGCLAHSRMEGSVNAWSMGSGSSWETIPVSKASDFTGDVRFLFAFRTSARLGENAGVTFDPFISIPISSMLKGSDPKIFSRDIGLRVGLHRRYANGGFWKRLRSGAPSREGAQ